MDPNLFHLDWDRTAEVLATIVVLSLIVERGLSWIFESAWYINRFQKSEFKELIAFLVAAVICIVWHFDAVSMIVLAEHTNWFGCLVTAGVIAGGSKGSIQLFREFLGFKSSTRKEYETKKATTAAPPTPTLTADEVVTLKVLAADPPTGKGKKSKADDSDKG